MGKRESKKEHILRAGLEVMKIHGYNGTSVKDIVDAAVVPKGSFYNYFPSKESFAVEALQAVADESLSASRDLLASGTGSPLQRLRSYFEQNASQACEDDFKVGCFFGNMCLLDEAKAAGEIAAGADTGMIAEFVMNAWEGTLMRMKASKSREPLDAFLGMLPQLTR
jgi:TetR/AcrR family transcriptional repressor of nem operon